MAKIQSIKFENLELKEKPYLFREKNHDRNDGVFAFKIFPDGTKDFYFIYYVNGKEKLKKIGRFGSGHNRLTLKQARDIYKVLSQKYKNGIDVKAQETKFKQKLAEEAKTLVELERRENLQGNLRQLAEFYLDYLRKNKSAKHVRNVEKALAKDLWIVDPEMKANKVTKSEILTILHPIVERGSLTMANRMRSYLM